MYDIKQFKPALYTVLLLGFIGFGMAAETPALLAFSALGLLLNAWLVYTGRFAPLPRWLANTATLLALAYVVSQILTAGGPPLVFIGQFLMLLQLIKLYEQRANRDYAQLVVLSLLLMVAAAINTASLLFGVLMASYLILSLYCCLIFHLKVEADRAKTAFPLPPEQINPATLQLDHRYLPRSMRRLTALVTVFALFMSVLVFLFFPRGAGQGVLGQLQFKPSNALTGFNDRVNFEQIARIQQNEAEVARVTVYKNEKLVEGTEPLLLRGLTLDTYSADPRRQNRTTWTRSRQRYEDRDYNFDEAPDDAELRPADGDVYRQVVALRPTGSRYLFALPGLMTRTIDRERYVALRTKRTLGVKYSPGDDSLQTEPILVPVDYEVFSTNSPRKPGLFNALVTQVSLPDSDSDPKVLAQVRAYAVREDVLGDLAVRKGPYPVEPVNAEIARALESHLRRNFAYTLDLTGDRDKFRDEDPIVTFLNSVKKGHCEFFASAMTLMCQSLGVPARVVVGFRCDEYNPIGGYYLVKQAHAHTWVEVLTPDGWTAYDPTSSREADASRRAGLWQNVKYFFDYLEYKWAENVVAYDARNRDNMIQSLDGAAGAAALSGADFLARARAWFGSVNFWNVSLNLLTLVISLMVLALFAFVAAYTVAQYRLRRRAQRIGLDNLPLDEQLRLARQLAFYDQFTTALHRHRISRAPHQTPLEFSDSLVFLPTQLFQTARRLTRLLYRVRFGQAELSPARRQHLEQTVSRFTETLDALKSSSVPKTT